MTVLAIASPKGGVGKTTIALNLAFALSGRGHRTLLVDLDPQGSIGLSLAGRPKDAPGLYETLSDGRDPFSHIIQTRRRELSLLTFGQPDMGQLAQWSRELEGDGRLLRLLGHLDAEYDLVIVDTPAGCGGLTREGLEGSTHVISPLQTDPLALRALPQLVATVGSLRAEGAPVELIGVVLTMTRFRESLAANVAQEAWSLLPEDLVTDTHIPYDRVFAEASAKGVPVGLMRRRPPPAAAVFDHLALEIEPKLGILPAEEDDEPIHLVD